MMRTDKAYYARRAVEERTAAMASSHPNVRRVHLELSERYQRVADDLAQQDRQPALTLVSAA